MCPPLSETALNTSPGCPSCPSVQLLPSVIVALTRNLLLPTLPVDNCVVVFVTVGWVIAW